MNRGRGRQHIFHGTEYYQVFLETLMEAQQRFELNIHAYCLMGNHYHLLLETPNANLSRSMRHINGVYTQRYNRIKKTDGPLFRGRFKSILVDADNYLLPLSRYIHRNPIETKRPLVENLKDYPWSSYPAYTRPGNKPAWLETGRIHGILGKRQKYTGYKAYTELETDEDLQQHYNKGNIASVLGDKAFKEDIAKQKALMEENKQDHIFEPITHMDIIGIVAKVFNAPTKVIMRPQKGRQSANLARKVAMHSCQRYGDYRLQDIAEIFGLSHSGSVSSALHDVKYSIQDQQLARKIRQIERKIIMKRTWIVLNKTDTL